MRLAPRQHVGVSPFPGWHALPRMATSQRHRLIPEIMEILLSDRWPRTKLALVKAAIVQASLDAVVTSLPPQPQLGEA